MFSLYGIGNKKEKSHIGVSFIHCENNLLSNLICSRTTNYKTVHANNKSPYNFLTSQINFHGVYNQNQKRTHMRLPLVFSASSVVGCVGYVDMN